MQPLPREFNPFALMIDPQSVLAQIEHSERLERLSRRVCRPLDKPMLGSAEQADVETEGEGEVDDDSQDLAARASDGSASGAGSDMGGTSMAS